MHSRRSRRAASPQGTERGPLTPQRQELSPRLDIEHAIRSRELSAQDIDWLRGLPAHVPQKYIPRRLCKLVIFIVVYAHTHLPSHNQIHYPVAPTQ